MTSTFDTNIGELGICIEGEYYTPKEFSSDNTPNFVYKSDFHLALYIFLKDWYAESKYLTVQTSGSTGIPKPIQVEKQKMINSACITCNFLGLEQKDTALLCMPLDYIAGKMMVIRSIVSSLDLHLVTPSGHPLKDIDTQICFSAMTPMQVRNTLTDIVEKNKLESIDKLIIGGGAIDEKLQKELLYFNNTIYSTYGMTETLSHIALRKINGSDASDYYIPFQSVSISQGGDDRLIIDAPLVSNEILYTNDIVDINTAGEFKILGRIDNVINSGGIKIQIEELEHLLAPYITGKFAITSIPDNKFGEAVVLVIESNTKVDSHGISTICPQYYHPKQVITIATIPLTETNKIQRKTLKELVTALYKNI